MKNNMQSRLQSFVEGEPCKKCGWPLKKYTQADRSAEQRHKSEATGRFYYWWFRCPKCGTMYMPDEAKSVALADSVPVRPQRSQELVEARSPPLTNWTPM